MTPRALISIGIFALATILSACSGGGNTVPQPIAAYQRPARQWDGRYVAVSDANGPNADSIYQFGINDSIGTEVSSTPLSGSANVHQFWIDPSRKRVVAPSASLGTVGYWKYPAGEVATKTIDGLDVPEGVAISK